MKNITSLIKDIRILLSLILTSASSFLIAPVSAQSLSDWQNASGKGIAGIPYSDLRSTAQGFVSQKDSYCKTDNPNWNGKDPRVLQNDVDGMKAAVVALAEKRNGFDREKSSATDESAKSSLAGKIKESDDKINELNAKISDFNYRIQNEKAAIRQSLSDAEKCLEARLGIYNSFARAIAKADNERDPQIQSLAKAMSREWGDKQSGHLTQIEQVRTRIKNLSAMVN